MRLAGTETCPTPDWCLALPERLGQLLIERHLYRDERAWGLARRDVNQELPYDEVGTAIFHGLVRRHRLLDQVGGWSEEARQRTIRFWRSWQDPTTGRFHDPDRPERQVNEKYVIQILQGLGSAPLYPHTTTSRSGEIETELFLRRAREDADWETGGWGVGSHTGFMARELFHAVNAGREELIPDLELGVALILSHQDPASGLWGRPSAPMDRRIGGALKVINRLYFWMGMVVPHTRALADTLIMHQLNGDFYRCSNCILVPRNVAELIAYCLEADDYRHDDLRRAMESTVEEMREYVKPDGSICLYRDRPGGVEFTLFYALGLCAAYLGWSGCPFPNPLAPMPRAVGVKYRLAMVDGKPRVVAA